MEPAAPHAARLRRAPGLDALLAEGVVVRAVPVPRAADTTTPLLRVSTAARVRPEDLDRLGSLLAD